MLNHIHNHCLASIRYPEDGGNGFLRKGCMCLLYFTGLHKITTQSTYCQHILRYMAYVIILLSHSIIIISPSAAVSLNNLQAARTDSFSNRNTNTRGVSSYFCNLGKMFVFSLKSVPYLEHILYHS
jgi:hypothetical protein